MGQKRKRQPYSYNINGTKVTSWKKIYVVNGVACHKAGDFYSPVSPRLALQISLAKAGV